MRTRTARRAAVVLVLALIASLIGCAAATTGRPETGDGRSVALRVENQSWCRVTVFRLHNRGASSVRIGDVGAMGSRVFRMPVDDGLLHIGIRPFACQYGPIVSNPVQVEEGSRVQLTIPPYIPGNSTFPVA